MVLNIIHEFFGLASILFISASIAILIFWLTDPYRRATGHLFPIITDTNTSTNNNNNDDSKNEYKHSNDNPSRDLIIQQFENAMGNEPILETLIIDVFALNSSLKFDIFNVPLPFKLFLSINRNNNASYLALYQNKFKAQTGESTCNHFSIVNVYYYETRYGCVCVVHNA